ncbi:MAG: DUF502 domain-containing protein [Phycisphaerae bacterium]|nr:DUF502 domain-containing protein [Phycisphaerae bacterium]MDD5381359.1 DUF502 domain-containing protein [Phycisphaerae bacterium]
MRDRGRFKSYFLRGLAVLLPTILTIWIFVWGYKFIQENISVYINRGIVRLVMFLQDGQQYLTEENMVRFWVDGWGSIAGFLISLIVVCIVGAIVASVVGKTLWRVIEKFIMNTPFLRQVYPYVKQITDFLLKPEEQEKLFSRVVLVEYPRKGVWSIGMVTSSGIKKIVDKKEKEFLTVFISTTPSPVTGFVIWVPKDEVIDADMTIEDAIRFIVSGGVISPQLSKGNKTVALPIFEPTVKK